MNDKDLKFEIESSHILGGAGECCVQGRGKWTGCTCYSAETYTKKTLKPLGRSRPVGQGRPALKRELLNLRKKGKIERRARRASGIRSYPGYVESSVEPTFKE